MKSRKMTIDNTYKEHHVFTQLSEYADFYKSLAFSIFGFITQGTKAIYNIDSYVYSSIQGTLESILESLNTFSKDLENIFVWHFSYLFYLNDHYMMSSDYVDSLDCGLTPEEGSQYFVAPFVQKIFDSVIKKNSMDLAEEIKSKTSMKLE